ncbi:MAG: hypothetical protein QF842_00320 [Candidatus Marinimicrobia bacterium]|nr:hypothetical protein [Candidatus Neomarinimicrobiota bacterium]MDP6611398.1 hypothetical protein [Candidatus Neomarinimicrobiota bacterium]
MNQESNVTLKQVFRLWLPLAGSWFLMGTETPTLTAFVARMALPEINLAAWGSLVYPISLAIEGPIIMLLAASTALAVDRPAYNKLFKYMLVMSVALSILHVLVAFTPIFNWVASGLLRVPEALHEPGQIGLQIMTPWSFMIAWRRLNQGVMIKYGNSRAVATGTAIRLSTLVLILTVGKQFTGFSGIIVGSAAVAISVTMEALYAHIAVQNILHNTLPESIESNPITRDSFISFYLPLAITPLMTLLIHPVGSAGMSRMPEPLSSLAAWPVVYGLVFLTRGLGFAFNEVVVSLAGKPGGMNQLRRFARILALSTMGIMALIAFTSLGESWFRDVSGLSAELTRLSSVTIMFAILMPGYQVYQSWYGGLLVHYHRTRGISEAVMVYVGLALLGLLLGAQFSTVPGIYWTINVFVFSGLCQTFFLRYRYKGISI